MTRQAYFRGSLNESNKWREATCLEGILYKDPSEESDNLEKKSFPNVTYLQADSKLKKLGSWENSSRISSALNYQLFQPLRPATAFWSATCLFYTPKSILKFAYYLPLTKDSPEVMVDSNLVKNKLDHSPTTLFQRNFLHSLSNMATLYMSCRRAGN